jgi:hypothetical protein
MAESFHRFDRLECSTVGLERERVLMEHEGFRLMLLTSVYPSIKTTKADVDCEVFQHDRTDDADPHCDTRVHSSSYSGPG